MKIVSIITDWNTALGSGHIQRMTNLYHYLKKSPHFFPVLVNNKVPEMFHPDKRPEIRSGPHPDSAIIVRDMRDSTMDEMKALKSCAKVLAVDDNGPGRNMADFIVDLLPNPVYEKTNPHYRKDLYIYGFTFLDSIIHVRDSIIHKQYDFAVYPGFSPSPEYIRLLKSVIPRGATAIFLQGDTTFLFSRGMEHAINNSSYGEFLLSSKILLTHFGITLYEGHVSGCKIIALNPARYHSLLTDMVREEMDITNLGTAEEVNIREAQKILSESLKKYQDQAVTVSSVAARAEAGMKNFYDLLKSLTL